MHKKLNKPTLRTAARYFLLQLPGQFFLIVLLFFFQRWVEIPGYIVWGLPALWIAKDILLFPILWRFYATDQHSDPSRMIGRRGYVLRRLAPDGHVHVQGERWQASVAEGNPPIEKGAAICVDAINGLRLTVSRCPEDA
jgi:membrane protein implicated in regulation of membrane protease activity